MRKSLFTLLITLLGTMGYCEKKSREGIYGQAGRDTLDGE